MSRQRPDRMPPWFVITDRLERPPDRWIFTIVREPVARATRL